MAELSRAEIRAAIEGLGLDKPYYSVRRVAGGIELVTRDGPVVWQKPKKKAADSG